MKPRLSKVSVCGAMLLIGFGLSAPAQNGDCPIGDTMCLDQRFGAACVDIREGATEETCTIWLAELQRRPDIGEPDTQLLVGVTYSALFKLSDDPSLSRNFRELGTTTFRQLLDQYPTDIRALYGLASTATSREEYAGYLRQIIDIDPNNLHAVEHLGNILLDMAGASQALESVDIRERAYAEAALMDPATRLRLAYGVTVTYRTLNHHLLEALESSEADRIRISEAEDRLSAFVDQVREDFRSDRMSGEINQEAIGDPDHAIAQLTIICDRHALSVFGAGDCMESVNNIAESIVASPQTAPATRLADAVGSILVSMVIDEWRFQRDFPDWRERFAESLRTLMTSGVRSGAVYYAYYYFELDDPDARLNALQQGSTLFPENRNIARALGEEYVRYGMRDEAVEQFLVAWEGSRGWDGSLEYVQGRVDEWLNQSHDP